MRKILFQTLTVLVFCGLIHQSGSALTTSTVTFLGTDPQFVAQSPVAIADLSGGGMDAAGNAYFANGSNGTILRMTQIGTVTTIMTGLKQPHLAVDYRGDVFVADTGNNRVLSLAAGSAEPVVRAHLPAPGSIVADVSNNFFFLSGGVLYEIIRGGEARRIGAFPGAALLAYGPANQENDTIYILGAQANMVGPGGIRTDAVSKDSMPTETTNLETANLAITVGIGARYTVSTYTYHNTTGTIATGRSFQSPQKIEDFGVDAGGNLIFAGVAPGASGQVETHLFEVTSAGDDLALTSPVNGSSIHLELDYNRNIYYTDAQGFFELMKGAIDFGPGSQAGGEGEASVLNLNFSLPTGVAVARTSYVVDGEPSRDFGDNYPSAGSCGAGSLCTLPVFFLPANLGISGAMMSLFDADGHTLLQVHLHGLGIYPMHELFTENEVATSFSPTAASLKSPAGISNNVSLGPLVTDVALGTLVTPYSSAVSMSGLGKPETVTHIPGGDIYATQAGMAGVLDIHAGTSQPRVAARLATEPNGVDMDGAGNLYISDHNSIFRVGVDGTESQLADPSTDDNYQSVESLAVDPSGNVYAFFAAGGPAGKGGLLKITPSGVATPIATEVGGAAGLAIDMGGGIYFSDPVKKQLETLRSDGTSLTLLTGLKSPKGVTGLFGPLLVDQGSAELLAPTLPESAFDFGNVRVGTTATRTFTVFSMGNAQTTGELAFDGTDAAFSGSGYMIDAGGSQTVTITFTPSFPGTHNVQLYDEANDYFASEPITQQYTVTGVGIEPEIRSPAIKP